MVQSQNGTNHSMVHVMALSSVTGTVPAYPHTAASLHACPPFQSIEADEGLGRRRRRRRRSPEAVSPIPQEQTGAQRLAERETISCTLRLDGAKAVQLAVSLLIPIIRSEKKRKV